jgi:hypothetical protein
METLELATAGASATELVVTSFFTTGSFSVPGFEEKPSSKFTWQEKFDKILGGRGFQGSIAPLACVFFD